jgi:hypothetical protein
MSTVAATDRTLSASQITLRPIQTDDLPAYQKLFNDPIAMRLYRGGPRDITDRFHVWIERGKIHSYSALAVVDNVSRKVIGHAILGHGDYEGDLERGWSEIAIVIDPAYWNSDYTEEENGIGTEGRKGIGTEVIRTLVAYARILRSNSEGVPSDVTEAQQEELEEMSSEKDGLKVHRGSKGIDWVYLPLTEIRATSSKANAAAYRAIQRVFVEENKGTVQKHDEERDLFKISL